MGATSVPSRAKVLVVGGGPGGSYTAAVLAREGIDVVVLESAKFPRYHIGESMLPSLRLFLRFIDCEEKVEKHGFTIKPGAAILYNQWKQEGYTKFAPGNHSWNVERAELDEILMRHAQECGAKVYEEHRVTELNFAEGSDHRPVSASYTTVSGESGSIDFDYLVDASGRAGIMSTKYLKNRHMNETLKNIACWAYWTDESGWGWFIPLQNGVVSVGIVMDGKVSAAKKAAGTAAAGEGKTHTLYDHYMEQFQYVPRLWKLLEGAKLRVDPTGEAPTVKSATDFSYTAATYAGDHYRLVGDASAFIDPFFSSGVHLAIAGGLTAATTIAASIRGHCSEEEAIKFHDHKVAVAYTRFLLTVLGSYKQIRNQKLPVLSDVNENNFDRAFDFIRPVIQGTADAGQMLTEDELQKAMDFVTNVFVPTDSEMQERVGTRLGIDVLAPEAPLLTKDQIDELAKGDEDTENVLKQANAIKTVSDFYSGPERLLGEVVNGLTGRTKVGSLGLIRV
ncbi:FAD/NAD(P)-binding domain-containing protein [Mycena sanguinolenta]|uniref:FAD/NAD(P)-binding domain-containing protein n=1 Tax=Mycena sanguinolenta TaxID=230812 RepID=A0A8H6Z6Q1_9AGAR|nr:FAD/NAD(P)-binding domain-containing protein [Mycena sanguinolenta]